MYASELYGIFENEIVPEMAPHAECDTNACY